MKYSMRGKGKETIDELLFKYKYYVNAIRLDKIAQISWRLRMIRFGIAVLFTLESGINRNSLKRTYFKDVTEIRLSNKYILVTVKQFINQLCGWYSCKLEVRLGNNLQRETKHIFVA